MNKNSERNYRIAITGAFSALVIVLGITRLGFISISPVVSYTILQVPVILAAIIGGFWSGVTVGAVFGIMSLVMAATAPTGILDPLFVNPIISVFPRVMIGVVAWAVFYGLNKIPHMPRVISGIVAAYLGTFTNTVFVFGTLFIFYFDKINSAVKGIGFAAVLVAHIPSAFVEGSIGAVLAAVVLGSMTIVKGKKSKLSQEAESENK
jgi:uncharacterized membrane protein